jgi:hypothetical protein
VRSIAAATVATLALATGCSVGGGDDDTAQRAFDDTCALVRSGVAAFNEGEYDETVERFQAALQPARDLAAATDDERADALLEAVEYYAALPADEYREAFETSPDFERHQETTLGQCGDAQPEDSPDQESET